MRLIGMTGAVGGLVTLFAVEGDGELLNAPKWFTDSAAAGAAIGSTILFLKYLKSDREAQRTAEAQRDAAHTATVSGIVADFREDRERDRKERIEGWAVLRQTIQALQDKK